MNLLSKVDLVEAYGQLAFNLDFYSEVTLVHVALFLGLLELHIHTHDAHRTQQAVPHTSHSSGMGASAFNKAVPAPCCSLHSWFVAAAMSESTCQTVWAEAMPLLRLKLYFQSSQLKS